jgi:hypothetical protein
MVLSEAIYELLNVNSTICFPYQNRPKSPWSAKKKFVFITKITAIYEDDSTEFTSRYYVGVAGEEEFKYARDLDDVSGAKEFKPDKLQKGIDYFLSKCFSSMNYLYLQKRIIQRGVFKNLRDFNDHFSSLYLKEDKGKDIFQAHTERIANEYESERAIIAINDFANKEFSKFKVTFIPRDFTFDLSIIHKAIQTVISEGFSVEVSYRDKLKRIGRLKEDEDEFYSISLTPRENSEFSIELNKIKYGYQNVQTMFYSVSQAATEMMLLAFSSKNFAFLEFLLGVKYALKLDGKEADFLSASKKLEHDLNLAGVIPKKEENLKTLLEERLKVPFTSMDELFSFVNEIKFKCPRQLRKVDFGVEFLDGYSGVDLCRIHELFCETYWFHSSEGYLSLDRLLNVRLMFDLYDQNSFNHIDIDFPINYLVPPEDKE